MWLVSGCGAYRIIMVSTLNYHERISRVRCRMINLVVKDIKNSGACRFGLVY